MSIGSIQVKIQLKWWYVALLKMVSFTNNKKILGYVLHKFWSKGSKISV